MALSMFTSSLQRAIPFVRSPLDVSCFSLSVFGYRLWLLECDGNIFHAITKPKLVLIRSDLQAVIEVI